jgi:heptosyltransferase-2
MFKILIITGVRIGDQLMNTPFFRAMRKTFPSSKISLATGLPALNVLKNNPNIDELIMIDKDIIQKIIHKGEFDLTIDLCGQKDTAYLGWISGAKQRIGIRNIGHSNINTELYTFIPDTRSRKELSFIDFSLLLAKKIGLKLQGKKTELFFTNNELEKAKTIFKNKGLDKKDFIVGIFVSGSRKRILWQPEKFGRLVDNILDKYKAKIIFFYDKDEVAALKRATYVMKNNYFLSGAHNIRIISALISLCNCIVVSNRGPMHIAAALQIPIIAIFGPYSENRFFPYSKKDNLIITKKINCRPCNMGYKRCPINVKCLKALSVNEVWQKVDPFLKKIRTH